ncbi:ankyrin repeat domain-containing protein [Enterococcus gilvus]|uniref:ankyrin repeat domain-containing protein n=1 Tax=Enterococcus gilvus TaxID=160453 RepID=UPI001C8C5615|nr:ankyrin repeat domain-containing protein [Enterococcus gilvus]
MKKVIAIIAFLFILAGCQSNSTNKEATGTSKSTVEKNVSKDSDKTSAAKESSSTQQSQEDKKMDIAPGSLLQAVSANDSAKVAEILKAKTDSIDEVNDKNETSLMIAVHNNQIEIAKKLIDAGANVNKQDTIEDSPYLYAGAEGRTEILTYMLAHSTPDQSITNRFGGNALIPAAEKGHLANVKLLLADGRVNINHQNDYGYTALIEAVALRDGSQVYQDIVAELLRNGANPNIVDNYGKSAKNYANELGYGNISKMLEENTQ